MNRILYSLIVLLFISINIQAQSSESTEKKEKLFYFAPHVGFGFFYPKDVNDFISDQYDISINSDMYVYYHAGVNGAFFFTDFLELQLGIEIAGSPKFVVGDDISDYYGYRKVTPNSKLNFHIPAGRKLSVILGAGLSYNYLRFKTPDETFKADDLGFSIQSGVRIKWRKFAYAPTLVFNSIKTKSDDTLDDLGYSIGGLDLSYTGVQISNVFYF